MKSFIERPTGVVCLFVICTYNCYTQIDLSGLDPHDIAGFQDEQTAPVQIDELAADLQALLDDPLDLNGEDVPLLLQTGLINAMQMAALESHKVENGPLLSILELQSIPHWDLATIRRTRHFVKVNKAFDRVSLTAAQWLKSGTHTVNLYWKARVPRPGGFYPGKNGDPPAYGGPNFENYFFYRYNYSGQLSFGINLERDAGENYHASNWGFADHLGWHFYWRTPHPLIRSLAAGDFKPSLGQGLIVHSGYSAGKSGSPLGIKKGGPLFRPHASRSESAFYRGFAMELAPFTGVNWGVFAFRQKLDATVRDSQSVSSIREGGLHRTAAEKAGANTLGLQGFGQRLEFSAGWLSMGGNFLGQFYDKAIYPANLPYNLFRHRGNKLISYSLDYSLQLGNLHLFGEIASNDGQAFAQVHGILCAIGEKLDIALSYRNYSPKFQSTNPSAFGETGRSENECGFFASMNVTPLRPLRISLFADHWKHPWLRFGTDSPSTGREYGLKLEYKVRKKFRVYFRVRQKWKMITNGGTDSHSPFSTVYGGKTGALRLYFSWVLGAGIEWRMRCEGKKTFDGITDNKGYLAAQDLIYKPMGQNWSFTFRYALYHVPDNSARVYAYENGLLYRGAMRAYSGIGNRWYLNFRYRPSDAWTLEFRYGSESRRIPGGIGSGYDKVDDNKRRELAMQVRYQLKSG